ncbi:putative WD repeat-containing protein [Teratosphaeria destructans]|uniref:WD repeat-containing protein n=1 Tax=Teratosphaeria destructans TaxID=418781 RepID=A0A9W7SZ88_9PEZI|nr:putative WD repeat-containing protein [Teratosphaeria destructans]
MEHIKRDIFVYLRFSLLPNADNDQSVDSIDRIDKMSRSNDSGHYFQTSDSLATSERKAVKAKNKHGEPIKLPSKILAAHRDPVKPGSVLIAEAAGQTKTVHLENAEISRPSMNATAPLTSLAYSRGNATLYAGCWDKHIYSSQIPPSGTQVVTSPLKSHTDFVKCLLATSLHGQPVLISGGADAQIIVWNLATSQPIHKLKGHTKALQDFAIDPLSFPEGCSEPQDSFILFSASSDREIRRWHIAIDSAHELSESIEKPILAHETSIYKITFDQEGDLWTASADKTAKHLVRSRGWEADTMLQHPDFVKDVVVSESAGLVVTACRDEEVRVWDASSGDLVCTYSGHYEEVTGLVMMDSDRKVVSVSIDGTVRQWSLERGDMAKYLEQRRKERDGEEGSSAGAEKSGGGMLTAEEEAELADLMDDDD